ncbi:uncharacterized protein LOC117227760, partial [Megalopta genalis]|uniref:uncharacterized protein LOC117227760 n=1 Tax=Megalopta genalis TaxID=115081 RepID=UPI003FD06259
SFSAPYSASSSAYSSSSPASYSASSSSSSSFASFSASSSSSSALLRRLETAPLQISSYSASSSSSSASFSASYSAPSSAQASSSSRYQDFHFVGDYVGVQGSYGGRVCRAKGCLVCSGVTLVRTRSGRRPVADDVDVNVIVGV